MSTIGTVDPILPWVSRFYVRSNAESALVPAAALLFVELLLAGWAESKRLADYNNPGSQGDGSFFGITDGLKGQDNGYPGASRQCDSRKVSFKPLFVPL